MPCLSKIFHSCWSVVASSRMRHGTRAEYRRATLYQMFKTTLLVEWRVRSSGDRYIDITRESKWHGYQLVKYKFTVSFCHSSDVVVYFILLSVVSKFCSGLRGIFYSHTGQHQKLVPVSPLQSIVYTYCQIIFVWTVTFYYFILQRKYISAITNDVFVHQAVVEWCMVTIWTSLLL